MSAGYSGTPLAKKLGIGEGDRVRLVRPPADLVQKLQPLPPDVDLESTDHLGARPSDSSPPPYHEGSEEARHDVVMLFCADAAALRRDFAAAVHGMRWTGGLWACWPKKSSSLHVDLAREEVREVGLAAGLVDNKVCAVDEDWSGLRFVVRTEDRPDDVEEGGPVLPEGS